jgi:diadenosine tetraphosphatase ApaH/serine/threonine PP2A family protein phosphatase
VRYLLISDVHGNREALEAVLDDARNNYDRILCCGDLVGYGPEPNQIVEWARAHVQSIIRGNHDRVCCGLDDLDWFNPIAQDSTRWTTAHLTPANLKWLRELPAGPLTVDGFVLAHGSPLDEDEYVTSVSDAANLFEYLESNLTFFGHTHLQGGFSWIGGKQRIIRRPFPGDSLMPLHLDPDGAYLVNPGSVGQPRDGDPRAAYAIFDSQERDVLFHRVAYDAEAVCRKVEAAGLPPSLGARLLFGR